MLISTSVMAKSNVEFGGKLYQFRNTESGASAVESEEKHHFRPLERRSGTRAPTGRNIGGAGENNQGYVFRPLRNRRRLNSGNEDLPDQNLPVCPAIQEEPKDYSPAPPPEYTPYQPGVEYRGGYGAPPVPPPPGYMNPALPAPGYPRW
ncbi:MAG: hypothetical protein ABFR19_05920 [Pseudomonadota bacterium]